MVMDAASTRFQEQFERITNLDKLLQEAPEFSSWSTLDLLTGFRMYTEYDYDSWLEIHNLELSMAAQDGSIQVVFLCRNISAFSVYGDFQVGDFTIEVSEDPEQNLGQTFHVYDYEGNIIHLFCQELEVLQAGPMEV